MKTLLTLIFFLASAFTLAGDYGFSLVEHVASYHTTAAMCKVHRCKKFNQDNLGLGLEINKGIGEGLSQVFARVGGYKDSYYKTGTYAAVGYRATWGEREGLHYGVAVHAGYLNGSGENGAVIVPMFEAGYKAANVELMINPSTNNEKRSTIYGLSFRQDF